MRGALPGPARGPLAIVSTLGALLPLWLGTRSLATAIEQAAHAGVPGSFPHLAFARQCFAIGFAWLALAAVGWMRAMLRSMPRATGWN